MLSRGATHVIGLISGTSADGVDAAICRIASRNGAAAPSGLPAAGSLSVECLAARTFPYPTELRERVLGAAALRTPELAALNA